jgi:polysaccharide biosynthesis/export protein
MGQEMMQNYMTNRSRQFEKGRLALALAILAVATVSGAQTDDKNGSASPAAASPAAVPQSQADENYVIGANDVLAINVWKEPEISRSVPVRSDGKISLPLVGDIQAGGRTPHDLKDELTSKLKNYISEPEVTVMVQEIRSKKFNVMGQVARPGAFPITNSMTILDGLALAGGFRDFAKKKSIYVLRKNADGTDARLPFNYKDVIGGKHAEQNVKLQPGDTVVVP